MIKFEHIKNLMENIRLGVYKTDNYEITCSNTEYDRSLVITRKDLNTQIQVYLDTPTKSSYNVTVVCGDTTYGEDVTFNVKKEDYQNILSYIVEWATAKDLNNECVAIDAFSL